MPRQPRQAPAQKADPAQVVADVDPLADLRQDDTSTPTDPTPTDDGPAIVFAVDPDADDPLASIVHQAVGAASACWETLEGAGVFQEDRARDVADSLLWVLRNTQGLAGPDDRTAAVATVVAAWHTDTVALGFLHKGGVCGCHYLANLTAGAILPGVVVG